MTDLDFIIITATEHEQHTILEHIHHKKIEEAGTKRWIYGDFAGYSLLLIVTGIGCLNTAHALTLALERHQPGAVVQIGIGGAYVSSGLEVGDIALADEEYYGDMGVVTADGWKGMEYIGIPVLENRHDESAPIFNRLSLDLGFVSRAQKTLQKSDWDGPRPNIMSGHFITVQQCSGVQVIGDALADRFNGICENMEGAAAAHICTLKDIPLLELRCISNLVIDRDLSKWNIPLAISRTQSALLSILTHWDD